MLPDNPKRKNEPRHPIPEKRKRKPKPQRPVSPYVIGTLVGVFATAIMAGALLAIFNRVQAPVVPTLIVGNPTAAPTANRPTFPPTWTPADTPVPSTELPTFVPATQIPSTPGDGVTIQGTPPTVRRVIIDVDSLPLFVWPDDETKPIADYIVRGAVRNVLTDGLTGGEDGNYETWWYIADGYGWIPIEINGTPTTRDYTPQALEEMIAETTQRMANDRENPTLYLQRGWMYYGQEDYGAAVSEITVAIELLPDDDDARLYEYRGKVYLDMENYVLALRDFDTAISLGLAAASVYNRRSLAYKGLGRYEEARLDLEEALRLNPDYGLLYSNLGAVIAEQERLDPAQLEFYDLAIQHDPNYPYAYSNRADYYRLSGDYGDHVINDYTFALQLLPLEVNVLLDRGVVFSARGDVVAARTDYTRIIEIDPNYGRAFMNRGIDYYALGDVKAAIDDLLAAVRVEPNSARAYYSLGTVLARERQFQAALYCFNRALALDPDYPEAEINRGLIYERIGGLDEAAINAYPNVESLITPFP